MSTSIHSTAGHSRPTFEMQIPTESPSSVLMTSNDRPFLFAILNLNSMHLDLNFLVFHTLKDHEYVLLRTLTGELRA